MVFQTSIPQTSACEVHASVITEWLPECMNKILQRDIKGATEENTQIKDVSNLIYICSTNPILVFKLHGFFYCVFQINFRGVQNFGYFCIIYVL